MIKNSDSSTVSERFSHTGHKQTHKQTHKQNQKQTQQQVQHKAKKQGQQIPDLMESKKIAASDAPTDSTGPAAPRLGPRAGRRVFDELPGTSEGKAALVEFEMQSSDFIESTPPSTTLESDSMESPSSESDAAKAGSNNVGNLLAGTAEDMEDAEVQLEFRVEDEIREEQVCFNFGADFELQGAAGGADISNESKSEGCADLERQEIERKDHFDSLHSMHVTEGQLVLGEEEAERNDEVRSFDKDLEVTESLSGYTEEDGAIGSMSVTETADQTTDPNADPTADQIKCSQASTEQSSLSASPASPQSGQKADLSFDANAAAQASMDKVVAAFPALRVGTDEELMQSIDAIPEKMAFKIGEVADMVGVKQYVLRYWESEFDALRPRKSRNGQRIYTRREVETALMIKKLLYTDRFSIEGARSALKQMKNRVREEKEWKVLVGSHERVRSGLKSLVTEIRKLRQELI